MHVDPKVITLSLDLYFKGVSLRKISNHVIQFYGVTIGKSAIHKWIHKYGKIISSYVNQLEPELSETWNTDEMKVKCGGKWVWLWNVMDSGTRFLLASQVSEKREVSDARKAFQKAKQTAKNKPEVMVTDGLQSYIKAFKKEFFTLKNPRTKHVRKPRFVDRTNNNIVERLQGTFRERDKVMRGLKNKPSAQELEDAMRNYYNFIRPHQALDGKTPAEKAGINLNLKGNKWLELIRKSSR